MTRTLLILLLVASNYLVINAQDEPPCTPDLEALDTIAFISPQPLSDITPNGGIKDSATAGIEFEYTFSILVPDTAVNFGGVQVRILDISFSPDTAIRYEPALSGFDYVCDPPNCKFVGGEPGCVIISGIATEEEIGPHELFFTGQANLGALAIDVNFPDPNLFPGSYQLVVKEDVSASANEVFASNFSMVNRPNPFSDLTQILVRSEVSGNYEFRVYDMLGQALHREVVQLLEGENTIDFDGSQLANGMYLFSLSDGRYAATQKMIVNRR